MNLIRLLNNLVYREKIIQKFEGKVNRIEGDNAYVHMVDSKGIEALATVELSELPKECRQEDAYFRFYILKRGIESYSRFEYIPPRQLTDQEWKEIEEHVKKVVGDEKLTDDY